MITSKFDGFRFHHNGDYSGDTIIVNDATGHTMEVPFPVLREFVLGHFRSRIVDWAEGCSDEAIADTVTHCIGAHAGLHTAPSKEGNTR